MNLQPFLLFIMFSQTISLYSFKRKYFIMQSHLELASLRVEFQDASSIRNFKKKKKNSTQLSFSPKDTSHPLELDYQRLDSRLDYIKK